MRRSFNQILSASMAVVIVCTTALTNAYAATPSGRAEGQGNYNPGNWPGYGDNPTPPGDHWGVRLSVTNMSQAGAFGITPVELGDNYTAAINQFNDLAAILKTKVWWF